MADRRKLIFVVTEDWYFISHRLPLARHFQRQGWEVWVATQINRAESAAMIRQAGIGLVSLPVYRGRMLSWNDIRYFVRLLRLYRRTSPDIVIHVAMKPIVYGTMAAAIIRNIGIINAFAGMGYVFSNERAAARFARFALVRIFRVLFSGPNTRVIVQNTEDRDLMARGVGVAPNRLALIKGVGVKAAGFPQARHGIRRPPVIVMVSRMLRDKGVQEYFAAARIVRKEFDAIFLLVGPVDPSNPNTFTSAEILAKARDSQVKWLGAREDIAELYSESDIAVLPSYREGLPKSLLEAAAAGLPIVTTDTSGCREIVADGGNGFLVPVGDAPALASAILRLLRNPELRRQLGEQSRLRAEEEFGQDAIFAAMDQICRTSAGALIGTPRSEAK